MKITDIVTESTTAGSIATVAAPMSTQKRNSVGKGVYGNEKAGNLLTGKKTNKKYANSVNESENTEDKAFKQGRNHGLKGIDNNRYINVRGKEKENKAYLAGRKEGMKLKQAEKTVNEGAMVDNLVKAKYKNSNTGETKEVSIRATSSAEAREQAESHYTHNKSDWKCVSVKQVADESRVMREGKMKQIASEEKDYSKMSRDEKIAYHNREMNASHGKSTGRYQYHKDQLAKFKKKPVSESKMKQVAMDLDSMQDGNFKQKYKKTKEQMRFALGDKNNTVHENKTRDKVSHASKRGMKDGMRGVDNSHEYHPVMKKEELTAYRDAHRKALKKKNPLKPGFIDEGETRLEEDDIIIVPGQGRSRKTGFIKHGESRLDHEVEMARSDLFSAAKNAKQVYEMIADVSEEEGLEGWVQEKIIKANDYLNTVREYLEGKQLQHNEMTGGVIAGGGVGESSDPIAKRITVKKWGGNDDYSWAVLVDGKPAVTGLSKREVPHYKSKIMKKLQDKPSLTGTNIEEGN